jgi:hypothetical protein
MKYCYKYFNLVLVPMPSQSGKDITRIFMNDISKTDLELFMQYYLLYLVKSKEKKEIIRQADLFKSGKKRQLQFDSVKNADNITPNTFQFIIDSIPAQYKFITQYLLAVCTDDEDVLKSYGISPIRKRNLILRMAESIETGIAIKERELGNVESIREMRRLLRIHCEKTKLYSNKNLSNNKRKSSLKESDPVLYNKILGNKKELIIFIIITIILIII